MKKEPNNIIYIVVIICLFLFLWNSFHYFQYIEYTSEFAGWLGNLGIKIKLVFLSLFFTFVTALIARFLLKKLKLQLSIFLVMFSACIIFLLLNKINHSILFPPKQTIAQKIEIAEENFKEDKRKADEYLKKGIRFSPPMRVVNADKKRILSHVKGLLSTDALGKDKINDSIQLNNINTFLNKWYEHFDKNIFKEIKNSLQIDFITYSPDFKRFVVTFSYKLDTYNFNNLYKYDGIILMGEKSKSHIELFNYSETISQYGFYKRESVLYNLLRTFSYLSSNLIDDKHQTHPHVLTREFWECSFFFMPVKLSTGESRTRFKTRKEFVYQKPSIYVKKESIIIQN